MPTRCPRTRREFPPAPPPPTALRQVPPARGVGGVRGRAVTALALTLRDVGEDALTRFILDERDPDLARGGGLRAGATGSTGATGCTSSAWSSSPAFG